MVTPSSGVISLAGIKAEVDNDEYNSNATAQASLTTLATGTINTNSSHKPNSSTPHGMAEWYTYDNDQAAAFGDSISFDFDGTDDYLEGSGNLSSAISVSTGSISTWVKINSHSTNGLIWSINTEEGGTDQIFLLYHNSVGKVRANFKGGNVGNLADSSSGLENDGNWHHFVVTWKAVSKASGNEVKLYEDGSLQDTDAIGTIFSGSGATFGFGRNKLQNYGQNFNGHMNDMAIFNDVLTAVEVATIYNSGSPKDESSHSGLVAYYTLEGYSNGDTTVADDSSNSYALTITNSTDIDSSDTP